MEFRIADTFTDSLSKLTGQEQKVVKTTAFDLQLNPANPGMQFHRLEKTKDPNFWSIRVNRDIRVIVHKTKANLLLCYVDHHDRAYAWAQKRKIERHPKTGAAQLVEVRERVQEIPVFKDVLIEREVVVEKEVVVEAPGAPIAKSLLFTQIPEDDLLGYGVPPEWLEDVRRADEESLFELADHLPQEAAEALLELAVGGVPQVTPPIAADADPFDHPDAQRRFRVLEDVEALERALEYPWEKWTVFLHPSQRRLVERDYSGPARVSGSAGTGKTVVALHRAVYLAHQHPNSTILLVTFSDALANALNIKLHRLIGNERDMRERIFIHSITELGSDLHTEAFGPAKVASVQHLRSLLTSTAADLQETRFTEDFLFAEWNEVIDAWQLDSWDDYENVPRLGRKRRLGGKQREALWAIFSQVRSQLAEQKLVTWPMIYRKVTNHHKSLGLSPFNFAIIDESQDLGIAELKMLGALANGSTDSLFFTGDLGQRIFQQPFSWKQLGVEIQGRSHTLKINYRTSHQIRGQADLLLPSTIRDVDGNIEERGGTISVFNGPTPTVEFFDDIEEEQAAISQWITQRLADDIQPDEIGVFVRSTNQLPRAIAAVNQSGAKPTELDNQVIAEPDCVSVSTMHLAKGLEFRAVAIMACDDEVIPLQSRIERVTDESDLEEVYNTERHLLYVACTRARDHLWVSGVDPASEFLDDLID